MNPRPPPSLDDYEAYSTFKKALILWKNFSPFSDSEQAFLLLNMIHDNHKHFKTGLKNLLLNTFTDTDIKNLNMNVVEDFLDSQLQNEDQDKIYEAFVRFEECQIKCGEKYREFTARFDASYRSLLALDGDLIYPDKILAMKLKHSARLNNQLLFAINKNVKWDGNGAVYEDTRKEINRITSGFAYGGEEKVEVKLSTTEGEKVVKYEDGVFYVDGVEMTEVKPGRGRGKGRRRGWRN